MNGGSQEWIFGRPSFKVNRPMPGRLNMVVAMLALLVGLALRFMVAAGDFPSGDPRPFSDDPPYHVLRLQGLADGTSPFPGSPEARDPMVAWPTGDTPIWPWGFDILLAVTTPLQQACGTSCMINAAGMMIPLLAAVAGLLLFLLARTVAGGSAPAFAIMAFMMIPAGVAYTHAGRIDHHVLEPLLPVLALLFLFRGGSGRLTGAACAAAGFACGIQAAFFPASPALTFPLFVMAGLYVQGPARVSILSAGLIAGTLLSLALSPYPSSWTFHSPSLWHMAMALCLSAGLIVFKSVLAALTAATAASPRRSARIIPPAVSALAATAAFGALILLSDVTFPEFIRATIAGFNYTTASPFAALSLEANSFFDDPVRTMQVTGWLLVPASAGLVALGIDGIRNRNRRSLTIVATATTFITLGLVQRRFMLAATPFIAILAAHGVTMLSGRIRMLAGSRLLLARTMPFLIAAITLTPSLLGDLRLTSLTPLDRAAYSAAEAVKRHREAGSGVVPAGALTPWAYGHLFKMAAGTPTVCDNFFGVPGADRALTRCLGLNYSTDDRDIERQLGELKVTYVVLMPPSPEQVAAETRAIGLNPEEWVDHEGRLSTKFARSFLGRTGMWANGARPGQKGPFGLTLLGRFRQIDSSTSSIAAEVLVLTRNPDSRFQP